MDERIAVAKIRGRKVIVLEAEETFPAQIKPMGARVLNRDLQQCHVIDRAGSNPVPREEKRHGVRIGVADLLVRSSDGISLARTL
jgi:hypothetical protein